MKKALKETAEFVALGIIIGGVFVETGDRNAVIKVHVIEKVTVVLFSLVHVVSEQ